MIYKTTKIDGVQTIELEPKKDDRGYFTRIFSQEEALKKINFNLVQINQSLTLKKGTIRGLHFQKPPYGEAKIVQVIRGAIYDVALDIREGSKTYGRWIAEELSERNQKILYIPNGIAQGFQTLTGNCLVQYFMSEFYYPRYSTGIRWNDPMFEIRWPLVKPKLSEKDANWPLFKKI